MLKYSKGRIVTGQVTGIEKYGIFVSLDEFYTGLIHISEISDGFVRDINNYVDIGETIHAKVVDVDDDSYHVKLSIKNMNYKINRRRALKLNEVANGFKPLEDNYDDWVNSALKRMNEENNG